VVKNILIFSDGTGQVGGLRPDQRLSNIYKMYRAMRPGPDSPIMPEQQVAFYDAGLGSQEARALTPSYFRKLFEGALGTGLDENVIDCYSAIIAHYRPGDRICLFGFSRGAYTVRALSNVLNLCGVPTCNARGGCVPLYGPKLRTIASEAVRKVYNHGAGAKRAKYEHQRETMAARFRAKYGSEGMGADGEGQGNVQPHFIGVFDTVAALRSRTSVAIVLIALGLLLWVGVWTYSEGPWWSQWAIGVLAVWLGFKFVTSYLPIKFFVPSESYSLPLWHPRRWLSGLWHWHLAWWSGKNYDRWVDKEIPWLRQALSIDEDRKRFPRVQWGVPGDVTWNEKRGKMDWLKQIWFAGNHSDIGGSYPEDESRLSDIALSWMIQQLRTKLDNTIQIRDELLVTAPNPLGLQHDERVAVLDMQWPWLRTLTFNKLTWWRQVRPIHKEAELHPTVLARLAAPTVPQMGEMEAYRPENLRGHKDAGQYWES
jgi:uncharacterized protein (DUF2235 family)